MSLPVEFLLIDALRHLDSFSVPGIGSFYRAFVPAKINSSEKKIIAPKEVPVFSEDISPQGIRALEEFLRRPGNPAENEVYAAESIGKEINQILSINGKYELKGLGRLVLGNTGLEAEWNEDAHRNIYSNLFGFKDVSLPAKNVAAVTPSPTAIPKPDPAPPVLPKPVPKPAPVVVSIPEPEPIPVRIDPPVVEEKREAEAPKVSEPIAVEAKPRPTEPLAPESKPVPVPPIAIAEPGPAQKVAEKSKTKENRKKRKFPWVLTLSVLLLVLLASLWFLIPREKPVPVTPAPVAEVPTSAPESEPELPPAQEAVQPGYYLIVASSTQEADVLREANSWKESGLNTEIIPPDESSEFYRLSVLHSTNRGELVNKMIELKDETYSWILEK